MKIMTVRAPDDVQQKLAKFSEETGMTRNSLILYILREWIDENITEGIERQLGWLSDKSEE